MVFQLRQAYLGEDQQDRWHLTEIKLFSPEYQIPVTFVISQINAE